MYQRLFKTFFLLTLSPLLLVSCDSSTGPIPQAAIETGAAFNNSIEYSVELTGSQVLPAAVTRDTGYARFSLNEASGNLLGSVTTSLESVIGVHIHEGDVTQVGSIVVTLVANNTAGRTVYEVPENFQLTAQQIAHYKNGDLYVDIHGANIELRAQLTTEPTAVIVSPELDDLQAKLFTPVCSGCHTGTGNSLPSIMNLGSAAASYQSFVGVYSIGEPEVLRVDPGDADSSLLIRKVEGTHQVGARMPYRGPMLDAEIITALRQWIDAGAGR